MGKYDVAVIGAGPAGFAAAMRAYDYGKKTCLIERGSIGGAGIHNGALASKTLWELSRDYQAALRRDRGFTAENVLVDFGQVQHCVDDATSEKQEQLERQLAAIAQPRGDGGGSVHLIRGSAHFTGPHTIYVEGAETGDDHQVEADNIVIATGSRPRTIPEIEVDGERVITSDHLSRIQEFPESVVIVGAGVIGCEFATILANFGHTKVYLIDRADRILPFEDADIARLVANNLTQKGVTVHQGCHLEGLERDGDGVRYTIRHGTGGLETIRVAMAVLSIGRVPNTRGLDLDKAGLELTERGHITDDDTRTSVPHIYAVGDVTLDIALVSVAEIEGRHAIDCMYGECPPGLRYENISSIMFLDPEVAAVGHNELSAQKAQIPYKVAVYGYSLVNRAIAMRATEGFIKLLVTNDDEMRILGMRALGAHASTSIEACSLVIHQGKTIRELAELLHPHPAVTEALQDCARMFLGTSIMKPHVFTSELRLSSVRYE